MIKVLIDLLSFLKTAFPLLFCVAVFALLFILLAKSIKKYYYVYYILFAIPFLMVVMPSILRMCGIETALNFNRIPVLGEILRDYIHMASLGHPLLIIVMYMGALDQKYLYVKKLMSIRKEISIISGFPILTHSWIRTINNFPKALTYFTDHSEFMANPKVTSTLGAGITNTVLVLGIVMLVLFFVLWITSFDAVHKRLGGLRWKRIQKWSYVLYALLFIHAMGLQLGRMEREPSDSKTRTEVASTTPLEQQVHTHTEDVSKIPKSEDEDVVATQKQKQRGTSEQHEHSPAEGVSEHKRSNQGEGVATTQNRRRTSEQHEHSPAEGVSENKRSDQDEGLATTQNRRGASEERTHENDSENTRSKEGVAATQTQKSGRDQSVQTVQKQGASGRTPTKGLADFKLSRATSQWIAIISLLLIYGSYLILRVKKAKEKSKNRNVSMND